jgi:MYXO-CTERM domain-containing protein
MKLRGFRHTMPALVLFLVGIAVFMAVPVTLAQAPGTPQGESPRTIPPAESPRTSTMDNGDDSSGEWGLLGLVGLLGLAGLMRRDRTPPVERTGERVGRP